jgi:hypothetical protein
MVNRRIAPQGGATRKKEKKEGKRSASEFSLFFSYPDHDLGTFLTAGHIASCWFQFLLWKLSPGTHEKIPSAMRAAVTAAAMSR